MDGVMEAPEEWASSYTNDEMEEANAVGIAASDALLLGRVTYEQMAAFWSYQPGGTPIADYMKTVSKHVVSTTLEEPLEWNNSTLVRGNGFAEDIARLKHSRVRISRSSAVAPSSGCCCTTTSSTSFGS